MKVFTVCLLLVVAANAAVMDMSFKENANLTFAKSDFKYRYTKDFSFLNVLSWYSASVDASVATADAKAKANLFFGLGLSGTPLMVPAVLASYMDGTAELNLKKSAEDIIAGSVSASFSGGAVALVVPVVQEIDPSGRIVTSFPMSGLWPSLTPKKQDDLVSYYYTTKGEFKTTFVISKQAGILKYGDTPVSPNTLEMIIEGTNVPLMSKDNHLRIVVAMVSASATGEVKGKANVRKVGNTAVYSAVSGYAMINDKRVEVSADIKPGTDDLFGLSAILKAVFGDTLSIKIANVDFPAGANSFIYDPAAGFGSMIYDARAGTAAISLFAVLFGAFVALF